MAVTIFPAPINASFALFAMKESTCRITQIELSKFSKPNRASIYDYD